MLSEEHLEAAGLDDIAMRRQIKSICRNVAIISIPFWLILLSFLLATGLAILVVVFGLSIAMIQ